MPKDLSVSALLDFYGPFLSEKQRNLLHHYYDEDLSLSEIAENEQITRQGVRDQINNYMRTVMGEEPVDPSLEVLHDEESW